MADKISSTDGDRRMDKNQYTPLNFIGGGYNNIWILRTPTGLLMPPKICSFAEMSHMFGIQLGLFQYKDHLSSNRFTILKLRQPWDHLIFVMVTPILVRQHLSTDAPPRSCQPFHPISPCHRHHSGRTVNIHALVLAGVTSCKPLVDDSV